MENKMTVRKRNINVEVGPDNVQPTLDIGTITLGEKIRKKMKNADLKKRECGIVSQAVCALLNSGGGVIKAKIKNQEYSFKTHGIGLDLEHSIYSIMPFVQKYLYFEQKKDDLLLSVESCHENISCLSIVTLKTNLYRRNISCLVEMDSVAALQFLKDAEKTRGISCIEPELPANRARANIQEEHHVKELAADCFNKTQFTFQQEFYFRKSTHVEIKLTDPKNPLESIIKILPRSVSSLANTDGGYLFFGLDGKEQQIIGFIAKKSDREQLERDIENCIRQLPVHHFCEEKQEIEYECKFIDVHGSGEICSCVLALHVERFCCAVFAGKPDSWHVEDNYVKPFTTEEWVQRLMVTKPGLPKRTPETTLQPSTSHLIPYMQSGKMTCFPEAFCMELFSLQEECEGLIKNELDHLPPGVLVFSKSWSSDLGLQKNQKVICDVLHISEHSLPTLYTFIRADEELGDDLLKDYCKPTALTLKQKLVHLGSCTSKIGILIKILYVTHKATVLSYDSSEKVYYPKSYYLTTESMTDLLQALSETVRSLRYPNLSYQFTSEVFNSYSPVLPRMM